MNKVTLILISLLLLTPSLLLSLTIYDIVPRIEELEDENTGLTIMPTLLIPLGGRLEGMGTAFTAMANDSGFIEANPSGSSMLPYKELSLFHHNWIADSNVEGIVYTTRINDLGLAVAGKFLYLPFDEYGDFGQIESMGLFSESIGILNISYNFFSNYYFSGLALGMNLKGAYRHVSAQIEEKQSLAAGMVDFGALTRFNFLKFFPSRKRNFSVGMAVKNIGIQTGDDPLPMLWTSGIAYSFIKPVTLAVDYTFPFSFNYEDAPPENWEIATGIDVIITNFASMQAGYRFKEAPRLALGCTIEVDNFIIVTNYNMDLTAGLNPLDKFSVEIKVKMGALENEQKKKQVDELFARGLDAYARGDYLVAIDLWEQALAIDPKFLLAKEYIETTKKYLELQEEMEDKQETIEDES